MSDDNRAEQKRVHQAAFLNISFIYYREDATGRMRPITQLGAVKVGSIESIKPQPNMEIDGRFTQTCCIRTITGDEILVALSSLEVWHLMESLGKR